MNTDGAIRWGTGDGLLLGRKRTVMRQVRCHARFTVQWGEHMPNCKSPIRRSLPYRSVSAIAGIGSYFFFCASISVAVATLHTDRHPQLLMRFIEDE